MKNLMTKAILHPLPAAVVFLILHISRWPQLTPFRRLLHPCLNHPFNNILPFNYGTKSDLVLVNSPDATKVSAPAMHTIVKGRQIRGRGWQCCCCGSSLWDILPGHIWIHFCWWWWVTMTMGKIFELAFLGTHCHWMVEHLASYLIGRPDGGVVLWWLERDKTWWGNLRTMTSADVDDDVVEAETYASMGH